MRRPALVQKTVSEYWRFLRKHRRLSISQITHQIEYWELQKMIVLVWKILIVQSILRLIDNNLRMVLLDFKNLSQILIIKKELLEVKMAQVFG